MVQVRARRRIPSLAQRRAKEQVTKAREQIAKQQLQQQIVIGSQKAREIINSLLTTRAEKIKQRASRISDITKRQGELTAEGQKIANLSEGALPETIKNLQPRIKRLQEAQDRLTEEKKIVEQIGSKQLQQIETQKQSLTERGKQALEKLLKKQKGFLEESKSLAKQKQDIRLRNIALQKSQARKKRTVKGEVRVLASGKPTQVISKPSTTGEVKKDMNGLGVVTSVEQNGEIISKPVEETREEQIAREKEIVLRQEFARLTPEQKSKLSLSTSFSLRGFEFLGKSILEGKEGAEEELFETFRRSRELSQKRFILEQSSGAVFGTFSGVGGVSGLANIGFTKAGISLSKIPTVSKFISKRPTLIRDIGTGGKVLFGSLEGRKIITKVEAGEPGEALGSALRAGTFLASSKFFSKAELGRILKDVKPRTQVVGREDIFKTFKTKQGKLTISKGDRIAVTDIQGTKFVTKAPGTLTFKQKFPQDILLTGNGKQSLLVSGRSITTGEFTTTRVGSKDIFKAPTKFKTVSLFTEAPGSKNVFGFSTTKVSGGKPVFSFSLSKILKSTPTGQVIGSGSFAKRGVGAELIKVSKAPKTFDVFSGGKQVLKGSSSLVKTTPSSFGEVAQKESVKLFASQLKVSTKGAIVIPGLLAPSKSVTTKILKPIKKDIIFKPTQEVISLFPSKQKQFSEFTTPRIQEQFQEFAQVDIQKQFQSTAQQQRQLEKQSEKQKQLEKQLSKQLQKQSQLSTQTQVQKQSQVQSQKSLQKTLQQTIQEQRNLPTVRSFVSKAPITVGFPLALPPVNLSKGIGKQQLFGVVVRKKGKFVRVSGALPKGEALFKGFSTTRKELSATFKLIPLDVSKFTRRKPRITEKQALQRIRESGQFRPGRIIKGKLVPRKDFFIQKRGKRLSQFSEVSSIQQARRTKAVRKRIKKKPVKTTRKRSRRKGFNIPRSIF